MSKGHLKLLKKPKPEKPWKLRPPTGGSFYVTFGSDKGVYGRISLGRDMKRAHELAKKRAKQIGKGVVIYKEHKVVYK